MSKIVARTLDFIELFANEKRPLTLSDISRILDIPFSSCHDVLQELQARGYVYEIGPRAGFYPTVRLNNLAKIISQHDPILLRAETQLKKLCDEIDESVSLAIGGDMTATYLIVNEPSHPLRFLVRVGDGVRSLHATSAGKAYLGSLSPEKLEAYLKTAKLAPLTRNTIKSKAGLRTDLEKSNQRGWFLNREESVEDATTISARFNWNNAMYIITIAGTTSRMDSKFDRAIKLLTQTARSLDSSAHT